MSEPRAPSTVAVSRMLGMVGQSLLAVGYLPVAVLVSFFVDEDVGEALLVCGVVLLVGGVIAGIAWIKARAAFGGVGVGAGWVMIAVPLVGLVFVVLIPGDREWGKLGAMIFGSAAAGMTAVAAGIVAAVALLQAARRRQRAVFRLAGVLHIVSAGCALLFLAAHGISSQLSHPVAALGLWVLVATHASAALAFRALRDE